MDYNDVLKLEGSTTFTGYDGLSGQGRVTALLRDGEQVASLSADESGVVVLDSTPFYGESGGQVGDTGYLSGEGVRLEVADTTKAQDHHLHHVKVLQGKVSVGDTLDGQVDAAARAGLGSTPSSWRNNSVQVRTRLSAAS